MSEVCEWREIPFGEKEKDESKFHHRYTISCGHGGVNVLGYYKNCPFCKKPIKVIEDDSRQRSGTAEKL